LKIYIERELNILFWKLLHAQGKIIDFKNRSGEKNISDEIGYIKNHVLSDWCLVLIDAEF
jgi:hypothetical protein